MSYPNKIITVGGGKGGVGKSVIATNMAVTFALTGQRVILVDADFGASNLHAFLGIRAPRYGFREYFDPSHLDSNKDESPLIDTGITNLKFLSGASDTPGSADISHKNQNKIIAAIKNLEQEADHIIVDLGPGTNFHIVDYFNMGGHQVVVSTPEMTSILNTFGFIKAGLFRRISQEFKTGSDIQHLLDLSKNPAAAEDCYEINQLREKIEELHPQKLDRINTLISEFRPGLIINRVRRQKDILMGDNLLKLAKKYLDVDVNLLGYLIESDQVRDSIEEMVPFLIHDPQSKPSENVQSIIGSLTNTNIHLVKKDDTIYVSKQIKLSSGWGH
ncbi:MAG: P-loop NTPase [Nitrospinaceae bacterium]|nr:MinD/ParA family protein [Nitrospinaceae bacterium]NIR55748.1 MinD/ParA family protein [Nitrospinaceae bacterium]NIS86189.1 MinD/ParA family protein [Nitrospinaceae bacterium]NIT83027.1 MinD/ParA family protein [Nitrospinaceae bacterium]NIU45240.1 MinD/ParA family protein [Nitrospinaceae bacterium]